MGLGLIAFELFLLGVGFGCGFCMALGLGFSAFEMGFGWGFSLVFGVVLNIFFGVVLIFFSFFMGPYETKEQKEKKPNKTFSI